MTRPRRPTIALTVATAALAAPGVASAHAGKTPPIATNYTARITHAVPGIHTKPVDRDQTLWLLSPGFGRAAFLVSGGGLIVSLVR